jgi:acyl carrier protein
LQEAVPDERVELLFALVSSQIRRVLRLEADAHLESGQRLLDLGLDSLMALELRRLLATATDVDEDVLPATLIFDCPTVGAVVERLAGLLVHPDEAATVTLQAPTTRAVQAVPVPTSLRPADLAAMSDDEVEALLLQKLSRNG